MALPAYLQNSAAPRLVDQMQNVGGGAAVPYVSIQGSRFTLVDSTGDTIPITTVDSKTGMFYLDCVVIDGLPLASRIFYAKAFDPNAPSYAPPDCWSDNGIGPSRQAPATGGVGPTCAACPKAEWGSKISPATGKGIPACGTYQKIVVMVPGEKIEFLLRIPPNSLKNWDAYRAKFQGQEFDLRDVITRVTFSKEGVGNLLFSGQRIIEEAVAKQREEALRSKRSDTLLNRGDRPKEGLPAPQITQQALPEPVQAAEWSYRPPTAPPQTAPAEPPKRPGRPRKTAAEAPSAVQTAPFRETAPPNGSAPHGIQAGVEPNAELAASLDTLFGS